MDKRIRQSLQFIELNMHRRLSLKAIAGSAFLSPRHFHRSFKKHIGTSPAKYIEERRMEKALQLLRRPQMQIGNIADALGYRNYETLTSRFKRYYSIAPGDLKSILDTIRRRKRVSEGSLDVHVIACSYNSIRRRLDRLKGTLVKDSGRIEAFVALRNIAAGGSGGARPRYLVTRYETK